MKVNPWKYPLIYTVIFIAAVGILGLLGFYSGLKLTVALPDWLRPIILTPILIAVLSTNLPDFLSKKVVVRLKWLHSRPGINQFYYFVAFQALVVIACSIFVVAFPDIYIIYVGDLVANVLSGLTVIIYIYFMLRILVNNPVKL